VSRANGILALAACLGAGMECHADAPGFYIGADVAYVEPTVDMSDGINFGGMSGVVHVVPESVRFDDSMLGWNASIGYRITRVSGFRSDRRRGDFRPSGFRGVRGIYPRFQVARRRSDG
jgi:hypothetical protein